MSVFDPELKENKETNFELNKFSSDFEKKLLLALKQGKEKFPDIIQCPIRTCGNPLKIEMREDSIFLKCTNCNWEWRAGWKKCQN